MDISTEQHNEHCNGWRWHKYVADDKKRMNNAYAWDQRLLANLTSQQRADIELTAWQELRERA